MRYVLIARPLLANLSFTAGCALRPSLPGQPCHRPQFVRKGLRKVDGWQLNPGAVFDLVFAGHALPERQPVPAERARRSRPGLTGFNDSRVPRLASFSLRKSLAPGKE
jgi:hypothetical protein